MTRADLLNPKTFKHLLKEALAETFREQHDLLRDAMSDAMEDIALKEAIRQGRASPPATRREVFRVLKGRS